MDFKITNFQIRIRISLCLKFHRDSVHTVTKSSRSRPVVEHMSQVSFASRAMHLGPCHSVLLVDRRLDRVGDRGIEARPSRPAVVLRGRLEQRQTTEPAVVDAGRLVV